MKDEGLRFSDIVFRQVTPSGPPSLPPTHLTIARKTNLKRCTHGLYIMSLLPHARTELPFKPRGRFRSCIFMCNNNIRSARTNVLGLLRVLSGVIANIVGVQQSCSMGERWLSGRSRWRGGRDPSVYIQIFIYIYSHGKGKVIELRVVRFTQNDGRWVRFHITFWPRGQSCKTRALSIILLWCYVEWTPSFWRSATLYVC